MLEKKENEVKENVPYQFTASPLNLLFVLDSDCLKMLNILIQEESFWRSKKQLVDGYFFKSLNDLKEDMFMGNDQDVRLTLEALYINGLIDIINQGEQMKASRFKINFEKIVEIDKISILEVKKFFPKIYRLKRGSKCSYVDRKDVSSIEQGVSKLSTNCTSDSTPKLYNKDKINNKDKIEKIENNIIDDIIIFETQREKDSNNNKSTSIGLIDDSKVKQEIDASATKAAAQTIEQEKRPITNINNLRLKLNQNFNRFEREKFYESLYSYSTVELEDIGKMAPNLPMRLNDTERRDFMLHATTALKGKRAS